MEKALQTMINNISEKTGKSLDQWKTVLKAKTFTKHSEGVNFLKKEHGVTHGFANTIITLSKEEHNSDEDLVTNQYKGKEALFPIYEKLVQIVKEFIDEICTKQIKRLLINTELSIKEIAYQSGFEETTNFYKYFKRQTQFTPEQFRANR